MSDNNIKISVIIPIYNDELYLKDALLSIQQQTFTNFECICVNDSSTDKSEEIIDEFVKNDKRFIKINRENGGVSASRNTGLEAAKGEYVFFMDHDDLTPKYSLQKLFEAAKKYDTDFVRGRMMMIEENFKLEQLPELETQKDKQKYYSNPLTDYYRHIRGKYKNWYYVWMYMVKKSSIPNIEFLEELRSGGEDNLFTFDVVGAIKNFVQIDCIVACHRKSKISVTLNGYKPKLFIEISRIIIPYIYEKYALDSHIDKRLLWWVYRKESYAVYRFLIRNLIRRNDIEHLKQSREYLLKVKDAPEFKAIHSRWNLRRRMFYQLVMKEQYDLAYKIRIII